MCMPLSRKFLTESNGEKIVKIGQYLAKIWTKYNSLVFWPTLYIGTVSLIPRSHTRIFLTSPYGWPTRKSIVSIRK